jgi:hypothetical protein
MVVLSHQAVARIACFTEHIAMIGDLVVGHQGAPRRVLDLLNDPTTSVLSLTSPLLVRVDRLDTPLGTFPAGLIRKTDLACVVVVAEPERPADRRFAAYVPKAPVRVVLVLRSLVVIGCAHLAGRVDPLEHLLAWPEHFIPVTQAGLVTGESGIPTGEPPEPHTVLVNREHIVGVLATTSPARDSLGREHARPVRAVNP